MLLIDRCNVEASATWDQRQSRLALALVAMICLAYLPTWWAGFIWDDDAYVVANPMLLDVEGLAGIWTDPRSTPQYYPLVHTTFWIEQHLWGLRPAGYHVTNVLLHALSAVCLWRLLQRWQVPGAWLCAAVFALHPVQVESVAWVTERKNVLSGLWYLISASMYWNFTESVGSQPTRNWDGATWRRYLGAFLAFVLALLSKTVTCSLPAALLLVLWWRRGRLQIIDWLRLAPFFVVGLLFAWLTTHLERTHVGAGQLQIGLSLADRFALAGRAAWFYFGKLLWPESLTFIYPKWQIRADELSQWSGVAGSLLLLATLGLLRHRIGRGPLVAALFFGGTLLPALGFFDVFPMRYSFVADHFQYLASLGPIVLLVSAACRVHEMRCDAQRRASPRGTSWRIHGLTTAMLLALGVLTWRQTLVYHDIETLWRDTLAKNPTAAIAHNNLATILHARGRYDEALAHLQVSVRLEPLPESHGNLGLLLAKLERFDEALTHYRESLRKGPSSRVQANLARLLARLGRHDEALPEFQRAIELTPDDPELRLQFVESLVDLRRVDDALAELDVIAELAPENPLLWFTAGLIWFDRDPVRAVEAFERSAALSPENPGTFYRLGLARERTGDRSGARTAYRQALRLQPNWPEPQQALRRLMRP
ncbi:MAG: tetratricopeptide repeat protein [Planctomycetaceae bacterium]|nr:tetratricopeptide repeat protein [Planctomycetaceae bacterium]